MGKENRNSGIEALKLLAMILVIFSHAMPWTTGAAAGHYMDLGQATRSLQRLVIVFFQYGGQLGNAFFVVASCWFLTDSSRVKKEKLVHIAADTWVISVTVLLLFLLGGYPLGKAQILAQFFPITNNANWYVVCYLLFYAIHPMLASAAKSLTPKKLLTVDIGLFFLYCIVGLQKGAYYYNKLIGFVCVFFFVAYIKEYAAFSRKKALVLTVSSLALLAGSVVAVNFLGLHFDYFRDKVDHGVNFMNPFMLAAAMGALLLVKDCKWQCRWVNYLSGMTLLVYIIHANRLIMDCLRQDFFRHVYENYGYRWQALWVIGFGLGLTALGFVGSVVYRHILQPGGHRVSSGIYGFFYRKWLKWEK